MKFEIKYREEMVDGEEVTIWIVDSGENELNVNEIMGLFVTECDWWDEELGLISVDYMEWDSSELFAIINTEGQILRKGIKSIETAVEENNQFIVNMSGLGMGDEATEYDLSEDESRMAVIDVRGNFIIPPIHDEINSMEEIRVIYEIKTRNSSEIYLDNNGTKTEPWDNG